MQIWFLSYTEWKCVTSPIKLITCNLLAIENCVHMKLIVSLEERRRVDRERKERKERNCGIMASKSCTHGTLQSQ